MNVIAWPETIPSRFFSGNDQPKANTETTSFLSGRQVSWQINTKKIMTYKMKLQLTKEQLSLFWTWFNDVLGQNANAFTCPAIGSGTYRFVSVPSPEDTNQKTRVLSMEIEEVF
ncbi:MAG: hypothetical protein SOZ96_12945 [Treponema sp.]|nr:hypothetical protein [Treponema sp.]